MLETVISRLKMAISMIWSQYILLIFTFLLLLFNTDLSGAFTGQSQSGTLQPTEIDGQYYLRGICPTGGKFCGTGFDLGIIEDKPPLKKEERNCSSWIQFTFKPDCTFPEGHIYTISKIYYHIWWRTNSMRGTMGYYSGELQTQVFINLFQSIARQLSNKSVHII